MKHLMMMVWDETRIEALKLATLLVEKLFETWRKYGPEFRWSMLDTIARLYIFVKAYMISDQVTFRKSNPAASRTI